MTEEKQPHEGEIWRKEGGWDWCRINRNETPEASNYDGALSGFAVSFGNYSFKRKRVYWRSLDYFVAVDDYADFIMEMEYEQRYLMRGEAMDQVKCCLGCANHRKTCFHGAGNLRNFTEEECRRSGEPYYRPIDPKEEKNEL